MSQQEHELSYSRESVGCVREDSGGTLGHLPQWKQCRSILSLLAGILLTSELGVPHKGPRKRAALNPPWGLFGISGFKEVIPETQLWVLFLS